VHPARGRTGLRATWLELQAVVPVVFLGVGWATGLVDDWDGYVAVAFRGIVAALCAASAAWLLRSRGSWRAGRAALLWALALLWPVAVLALLGFLGVRLVPA
jgi:hypothetical protein